MNAAPPVLVGAIRSLAPAYGFGSVPLGLILAQSALETGWFSSSSFLVANNCFGLRRARLRRSPAVGVYLGHARYSSIVDSVADYFDRQRYFDIPDTTDPDLYVAATVASGYATAANYGPTWLQIYRQRFAGVGSFGSPVPLVLLLSLYAANVN